MKLLILFLTLSFMSLGQTTLINEQFSATPPTGWLTTSPNGWGLDNYGVGNAHSGAYAVKLSNWKVTTPKYLYIPITVQDGYTYVISFWTKRICSVNIIVNETTNLTTPLQNNSYSMLSCSSNFSTWYQWTDVFISNYTGTIYYQILATSVYFSTTLYIDDVRLFESPPIDLPIELLYFVGKEHDRYNHLTWSTASESNNDYYNIEKTIDGVYFENITKIQGAGTSNIQLFYEYDDYDLSNNICYYRLKQTDYDGKYKYHDMISVDNTKKLRIIVKVVNLYGIEVDINTKGLLILVYSDGNYEKIFNF